MFKIKYMFFGMLFCLGILLSNPSSPEPFLKNPPALTKKRDTPINEYVSQIKAIQDKTSQYTRVISQGLRVAKQKRDGWLKDMLLEESEDILSNALEDLNTITPPEELKIYHGKIIDSYIYRHLAVGALLQGNAESAAMLDRNGTRLTIEALEELKSLLIKFDAPKEVIDNLSLSISEEKNLLEY